ncbi:MAG: LLM class F420-dependent oxidoreductase [Chloroflexi bacterium]|nr:LLM class F420-dependent oxidoreductase [Chloroflexota bacterium]MCY3588817.1 LLM class F420-dependent oxidoreductase [Chloroflexota bacterium]MCY3687057.1 LLM class F420-dependent oxidoreductase [Chloroflexota bacterium]MDE2708325.1 LLM class F420-dependent oxidoreductase [Chloroflexota bacterium]
MTDFGVSMFPTDYAIQPPELGREVEARGFESLWFPEHTHIPTSRISPWPGGGDLPQEYWHTHDPFVSLMAAAAATETIKVGTGILLVPEHDVIVSAKSAASLDMISGGRLILGIGAGWNAEELENHGWNFKDRWKVTREIVLAWRELWTQDEPEFHGEFIDFDPVWSYPKPAQENGPDILLGAQSKWAFDRVVDYCDGWLPIALRGDMRADMEQLRAAADRADRDFETINRTVFGVGPDPKQVQDLIDIGFQRIIFGLPPAEADTVIPLLDRYNEVKAEFNGG